MIAKGAHLRLGSWETLPNSSSLLALLDATAEDDVLVLKDQHPTSDYPSPASAYLDAASLIVNHAERTSAGVRSLCAALRSDVPHAYGNLYLTPPCGKAVDAHADDRDVLVVQLFGAKLWKVYADPPCSFPEPHEQVGKGGRAVPESACAKLALSARLVEGDTLYIPRGWVHEAETDAQPSLHLTLAFATHDWSWARLGQRVLRSIGAPAAANALVRARLDRDAAPDAHCLFWRRSAAPALVCAGASDAGRAEAASSADFAAKGLLSLLHQNLQDSSLALGRLGKGGEGAVSDLAEALGRELARCVQVHNERQDAAPPPAGSSARGLSGSSYVRRRREGDPPPPPQSKQGGGGGLTARAEIADALLSGLSRVTAAPCAVSDLVPPCPLVDEFSRVCFARVCTDAGLLLQCTEHGEPSRAAAWPAASSPGAFREGSEKVQGRAWPPLASSPGAFTAFAEALDVASVRFVDVLGLEEELLELLPAPCMAMVLLFPTCTAADDYLTTREREAAAHFAGPPARPPPFFVRQLRGGTCGTVAALHALVHSPDQAAHVLRRELEEEGEEAAVAEEVEAEAAAVAPVDADSRRVLRCSRRLLRSPRIRAAHDLAAGATSAVRATAGERQGRHFVTWVPHYSTELNRAELVLLDGRRVRPIRCFPEPSLNLP